MQRLRDFYDRKSVTGLKISHEEIEDIFVSLPFSGIAAHKAENAPADTLELGLNKFNKIYAHQQYDRCVCVPNCEKKIVTTQISEQIV